MTAYRDPMPGPFVDAAAAALREAELRRAAREARWQEGRAEALRSIAEFNAAVAPAHLAYDVDARRGEWTTLSCNYPGWCIIMDRVRWGWTDDEDGWVMDHSRGARTFAQILLDRMKEPTFQDQFAKMRQVAIVSQEIEAPVKAIADALMSARDEDRLPMPTGRAAIRVVGSLGLGLSLCGVCLALVVALHRTFPVLFW